MDIFVHLAAKYPIVRGWVNESTIEIAMRSMIPDDDVSCGAKSVCAQRTARTVDRLTSSTDTATDRSVGSPSDRIG